MSDFTLADLLPRFDEWRVVSAVVHNDMTELRMASAVAGGPDWVVTHGVVFVDGGPFDQGDPIVGTAVRVAGGSLAVGPWQIDGSSLIAGQLLDSAIVVVQNGSLDPLLTPSETADAIIAEGTLLWPQVQDLPEELRGVDVLDGITRIALTQPSLAISVTVEAESHPTRAWDTFVTPFGVLETERHLDTDHPMAVSYFPLSDVPSRLWERSGIARLIGPGGGETSNNRVTARSTFLDDKGLAAGALSWEESEDGLTTSLGPIGPLALASELLRMLPGGDIDLAHTGKGVVGGV